MARPSGKLCKNDDTWTLAKFNSFIKNNLRSATRKWAPIQRCRKRAHVGRGEYRCDGCHQVVAPTIYDEDKRRRVPNVFVDHIVPIIDPEVGFVSWDNVIERMFCSSDNLQLLCLKCHKEKSEKEIDTAKHRRGWYQTNPREYTTYVSMKSRCNNPNVDCYKHYGGRGIKVCPSWEQSFENFLADMGERPEGYTLDRIDYDGDYSKENCRWVDWETQQSNKRSNVHLEWEGKVDTLAGWSRTTKINRSTISHRIRNYFTVGEALGFLPKPNKQTLEERRNSFKGEE